jgi:hypothetical protein
MLNYFKVRVLTFLNINLNLNLNVLIFKQLWHQLQATCICYPTIYDMTMLALAAYMKILIEWKHPVYPDRIFKDLFGEVRCSGTIYGRCNQVSSFDFP